MNIIQKTKELNLPLGQYVVIGSGPLQARGIRDSQDVDLLVTEEIYKELRNKGWQEEAISPGRNVLKHDVYDVGVDFVHGDYRPETSMLIKTADIIDGVPFINLGELLKWKTAMGRDKDKNDILLIQKYLLSNPNPL